MTAILVPMTGSLKPGYGLGGRIDRALRLDPEPLFPFGTDEYWMEQALLESMNSSGICQPNPAVGCILVKGESVISRGFTQAFGKEHAERMAFNGIPGVTPLEDVTAYVTLEPCSHFGRQPPCVDLLLSSSIGRVVIAVKDPDFRVAGEGLRKLEAAGKQVTLGVLQDEAFAWNWPFMKTRGLKKTVWIGKWAQMPSGHLSDSKGNSKWITNEQSRAYTHWLRQKYDCIVVGARTFILDRPKLTVRDCAPPHQRNPDRIIFDPRGALLGQQIEDLKGFRVLVSQTVLHKAQDYDPDVFFPVLEEPESPHYIRAFQEALGSLTFPRPLQSVLVEGGARLLRSMIEADALDALHVFTGSQRFSEVRDRERVQWQPGPNWILTTRHHFADDRLHEWIKED